MRTGCSIRRLRGAATIAVLGRERWERITLEGFPVHCQSIHVDIPFLQKRGDNLTVYLTFAVVVEHPRFRVYNGFQSAGNVLCRQHYVPDQALPVPVPVPPLLFIWAIAVVLCILRQATR